MKALVDSLCPPERAACVSTRRPAFDPVAIGYAAAAGKLLARMRALSFRAKGLVVFVSFVIYSILVGGYVIHQKTILLDEFATLERMAGTISALGQFDVDILRVGNASMWADGAADGASRIAEARVRLHTMWNEYAGLTRTVPEVPLALTRLDAVLARLADQPSQAGLTALRAELAREHASLNLLIDRLHRRQDELARQHRQRSDAVARIALLLGAGGSILFGMIITVFFTRLTNDILLLKNHALRIVQGERHDLIPVFRRDEMGELMGAINQMSQGLDERDKQLNIERHKYYYREKMAAIGDLAAGIAHEIGNPISAIAGIAESMRDRQGAQAFPGPDKVRRPDLILAQTARLSAIAREISDFATPVPAEHQLVDLNGLIRNTCRFVRYDRRFRSVSLDMNLDSGIPAINAVGDRVIQVIMNLLINAVDALEGLQDRVATIRITTSTAADEVCMAVQDNGCGMDENAQRHAFEAFFTTKRPGRGTGLGLALCYSIVSEHGGRIDLESVPDEGTCVSVSFPLGRRNEDGELGESWSCKY